MEDVCLIPLVVVGSIHASKRSLRLWVKVVQRQRAGFWSKKNHTHRLTAEPSGAHSHEAPRNSAS
jgi:hypothetical protein